jgi:predicted HTH transcriptional regulator
MRQIDSMTPEQLDTLKLKGMLPDITRNYHRGNPQSVAANKVAHKFKLSARQRILHVFATPNQRHWTCEEIEGASGLSHQTCSARLSELKRDGKIKQIGTRKTRSGSPAAIYQVV